MITYASTEGNVSLTHVVVDDILRRRIAVLDLTSSPKHGFVQVTVRDIAPTFEHEIERDFPTVGEATAYVTEMLVDERIRADFNTWALEFRAQHRQF